ncbi:maleylacetoacetate isomerase (plasmid) [Aminobacter sp. UC22_36]|uniref:maleylacetoacetate isomerase n=1 Tax=Aminobacter sp. UC22_36 TaxID=3374549 RepID=UPI003757192E
MTETVLFDYWRSSASYRVRIALNMLGQEFSSVSVDLLAKSQKSSEHLARNPQGLVPVLEIDGHAFTQSLAIIEYLDETRHAGFLPADPVGRQRVRQLSYAIAMEIHAVCNTGVVAELMRVTSDGEATRNDWMQKFIGDGMVAFEKLLDNPATGKFCHGDTPGMADFCLVPQVYNARRWNVDVSGLTRVLEIAGRCEGLDAFAKAHPDRAKP